VVQQHGIEVVSSDPTHAKCSIIRLSKSKDLAAIITDGDGEDLPT